MFATFGQLKTILDKESQYDLIRILASANLEKNLQPVIKRQTTEDVDVISLNIFGFPGALHLFCKPCLCYGPQVNKNTPTYPSVPVAMPFWSHRLHHLA